MLVLSRQRDETIMIGDDVEITVVDIRGDKVRLGITAPRKIQVHRKEVYDAIKRENQQAAKLSPRDVSDIVDRDAERKSSQKRPSGGEGGTLEMKSPGAVEGRSQDKRPVDGDKSDDGPRSRETDRSQ
jgi:carbon storage regulator